jgi:ABC-type polysaccharide/polyol phosphate export permease
MVISALTNLLTFLISLPILFGILAFYGMGMKIPLVFFPLLVMIQGMLIVGLGLIIAILNVFYRDVAHVVSVAIMLMFYITPVFYETKAVSGKYHFLFTWNPMAVLIQSYRAVFFYGTPPEWGSVLYAFLISAVLCGIGYVVYYRQMHNVVDLI